MNPTVSEMFYAIVVGQVVPSAVDVINKHVPNSKARYAVSMLACMVIGGVMNYGEFKHLSLNSVGDVLGMAGVIFMSAQTAYKTYYDGSTLQTKIRAKKEHFVFSAPETQV